MDKTIGKIIVHPSATVEDGSHLGAGVRIWHNCHVRTKAQLGDGVSLGMGVYVDIGVTLGRGTRVQNGVSIYAGVKVADWVFIGPHVVFTNDLRPRAGARAWNVIATELKTGCSIGAGVALRCGITVGEFSMVAAGATLTKDVPPFHLALGFPAEPVQMLCACAETIMPLGTSAEQLVGSCCKEKLLPEVYEIALKTAESLKKKS